MKTEFPDHWGVLYKKQAFPYEYSSKNEVYQKIVNSLKKKEDFFSELKNACPDDSEIQQTNQNFKIFDIKNGEDFTILYKKIDIISLVDVFEKLIKVSNKEYEINPLCCFLYVVIHTNVD